MSVCDDVEISLWTAKAPFKLAPKENFVVFLRLSHIIMMITVWLQHNPRGLLKAALASVCCWPADRARGRVPRTCNSPRAEALAPRRRTIAPQTDANQPKP